MASIEAEKREEDQIECIASENQHENPPPPPPLPPQNKNTNSQMSVKVENPPPPTESSTATQIKPRCFSTYYERIPKPLRFVLCFVLTVCLAPVGYACVTVATFTILPIILGAFVVLRLFQFVIRCEDFDKHVKIKFLMRYWIFVVVSLILLQVGIFYPIAKYVPELKLIMIIGLPITKWVKIICILIGIYLINFVSWTLIAFVLAVLFTNKLKDAGRRVFVLECISEIFGCLLILWAEVVVMNSVPTFKESKIFGVYTRKWIKVSLFVLIGYNIISLITHILAWTLPKLSGDHNRIGDCLSRVLHVACCDKIGKHIFNTKYVAFIGIGVNRSIIFILSAVMLLATWLLYFDDQLNTPENKRILKFGTWTLLSLLICSFFWLIKSCILLSWEAHAVNNRLHSKIKDIGKQLYFLVLLSIIHYRKVFGTDSKIPDTTRWVLLESETDDEEENVNVCYYFDRKDVREKLINRTDKNASIYNIQRAMKLILKAEYFLSKESIFSDLRHLQKYNTEDDKEDVTETLEKIVRRESYSKEDWNMLQKLLHGGKSENSKDVITFGEVKKWMERAHSRCRFLANTIISERELQNSLNRIICGVILGATFIMWLLITGMANTKVLVLIASPFLAATFIFGDTCKSLFKGLIFVYIVQSFDVGDLCFIDDNLLEVKTIGLWSTTFEKVRTSGKQQEVIYPNSIWDTKNVINYKTEFDWNDKLEFTLSSPDQQTSQNLKGKIEAYLEKEKDKFAPHFHSVEFLEIGDTAKVAIHIKHKIKTEGWTNFECLKEKEKRRFAFAIYIQDFISSLKSRDTPGDGRPC